MQQISTHIFTGLLTDISVSKTGTLYLIDAHNIRITAREGETLLSITNEKGPRELTLKNDLGNKVTITGTIIGHCVLNQYLVLFIHDDDLDRILRIDMSKDYPEVVSLFNPIDNNTSLGFDVEHPIEAMGYYESELILKVYWTDGINLPRAMNIMDTSITWNGTFDYTPELELNETVEVEKQFNSNGIFSSGVIQYAFTYYNKYRLETNIFHVTPLYCMSHFDRGASPEDRVSNSFKITITGYDKHFDYIRIYSITRNSLNGIPAVKRVEDIYIKNSNGPVSFIDTGSSGNNVDPTYLLYVGGEEVMAETLCSKDGTLFLGGLLIKRKSIDKNIKKTIEKKLNKKLSCLDKTIDLTPVNTTGFYVHSNGLNTLSAGFKSGEWYRLGILFLYKNGKWSEPCYIGNFQSTVKPLFAIENGKLNISKLVKPIMRYELPLTFTKNGIDYNLKLFLKDAGYKKMRALIAMPLLLDRTILAQGIICPTLFTAKLRVSGNLWALSSWFFRASKPVIEEDEDTRGGNGNNHGSGSGTHRPSGNNPGEVDTSVDNSSSPFSTYKGFLPYASLGLEYSDRLPTTKEYILGVGILDATRTSIFPVEIHGYFNSNNRFKIDPDIMTFHSPEVDFDDSILNQDLNGFKGRIVGYAECMNTASDIDLLTSTPTISNNGGGFIHESGVSQGNKGIISGWFYDDYVVDEDKDAKNFSKFQSQKKSIQWVIYPWQLNGSLNNDINRPVDKGIRSAILNKKTISNLRFFNTAWDTVNYNLNILSQVDGEVPQVFHSDHVSIVKIGNKVYEGNIDTMLLPDELDGNYFIGDPFKWGNNYKDSLWKTWSRDDGLPDGQGLYYINKEFQRWMLAAPQVGDHAVDLVRKKDGVRMKYKSTPHIVMATQGINTIQREYPSLHIVELYRKYDVNTLYGGTSKDAMRANLWIPAGKSVPIDNGDVIYEYGDTWYTRYDCLKTFPYTKEDPNQIVEIGSFMLESHINGDGRYDRNRGQINNLNMTPLNFNLINMVYSQLDNYFNYRILDDDFYELDSYPNQITWSLTKAAAMDIDPWTSVTMASTYDLDGSKGKIQALKTWKDAIYCFLDRGISQIMFNSRVLIPTSDHTPIEITNSYKVDGKRYLSDGTGCVNKYSICESPSALYFIDSTSNHLYSLGETTADISASKNTTTWFKSIDNIKWSPDKYSTRLFYDNANSELYITTDNQCLCYNELLLEFVSFMSYENSLMFGILNKFYCIKNNYINRMFDGEYGYFFNEYKPYDFTFTVNGSSNNQGSNQIAIDKIFTNIDFRADRWLGGVDNILSTESPFDYIRVFNEYQDTGEVLLKNIKDRPSNLKKKFRTWRINIPRNAMNRRDRIRNNWCKIKIGSAPRYNNGNNDAVVLHDLNVTYYI